MEGSVTKIKIHLILCIWLPCKEKSPVQIIQTFCPIKGFSSAYMGSWRVHHVHRFSHCNYQEGLNTTTLHQQQCLKKQPGLRRDIKSSGKFAIFRRLKIDPATPPLPLSLVQFFRSQEHRISFPCITSHLTGNIENHCYRLYVTFKIFLNLFCVKIINNFYLQFQFVRNLSISPPLPLSLVF